MIRKCFTVNPNRTKEEINSYEVLLEKGIYVGVEIFYPYQKSLEHIEMYKENIKRYLKYPNVEMVCHLPYGKDNNLASLYNIDILLERFKSAIDFSNIFGIKKLTLHPGCLDGTVSREEGVRLASIHIKELCVYAKKYNMTIMLENLIGENELMRTVEEYFELKKLINEENLKFIFDAAHYHASKFCDNTFDIIQFLDQVKDDLYHLHISDNDGTKDMHARIGLGTIDYKAYFKALKEVGYNGLYSSEVLFNSVDELITTANDMDESGK